MKMGHCRLFWGGWSGVKPVALSSPPTEEPLEVTDNPLTSQLGIPVDINGCLPRDRLGQSWTVGDQCLGS